MGWQNEPFVIEVKKGDTKAFCVCGKSRSGPYCDGQVLVLHEVMSVTKGERNSLVCWITGEPLK